MKLKIDQATGKAEVKDGMPVYVGDDGTETTFDLPKLLSTAHATREERDRIEREAKALRESMKQFGSTEEEIKAAIEKLRIARNLDDKKLVDAGKVEELVSQRLKEATTAWESEKSALAKEKDEARATVRRLLISSKIAGSSVLSDYLPTPDLIELALGEHFDVDGDRVVAYRDPKTKERIYSAKDPGQLADVDEALAILLKAHPNHDKWKKSANASGSGAPGAPGGGGAARTITRDEARNPAAYRAAKEAAEKAGVPLQIAPN